jgi:hypothetical protein
LRVKSFTATAQKPLKRVSLTLKIFLAIISKKSIMQAGLKIHAQACLNFEIVWHFLFTRILGWPSLDAKVSCSAGVLHP